MNGVVLQAAEWGVDALGFASTWLLGSHHRAGWALNIAAQIVWLLVAVPTHQWAFVVASFVYGAAAVRGWARWRRVAAETVTPCGGG